LELEKFKAWQDCDDTLLTHAKRISSRELLSLQVEPDGNCLLYSVNTAHQAASRDNTFILENDDLRMLAAAMAREHNHIHGDTESKQTVLEDINDFIHDKCAFQSEIIIEALASIRNGQIVIVEESGIYKTYNPNPEMRALLFDRPEEHQTTEPIYLLNRLTKSAHYDATMWLLPTPPNPIASPQKRGRPTHGDPSQVPSPEETQTMRPRHSISPPTASSPFELDENQGYEDTPDHESPDQLTNHTQPRPTSPTPLPQLQPFSNQGALMPPPPLPPIQATENPRPIHQITTLPRRLSPNPLANPPSPPITLTKSPPLIKPQPSPTETMHEPKNPATGNPPHPNVSEIQLSISSR
jgi:hypothetical protein